MTLTSMVFGLTGAAKGPIQVDKVEWTSGMDNGTIHERDVIELFCIRKVIVSVLSSHTETCISSLLINQLRANEGCHGTHFQFNPIAFLNTGCRNLLIGLKSIF